jgi:heptosyltransferase-2
MVGGVADVEICSAVAAASGVEVLRFDGAETLEQTIAAIDAADVLVTNDSGAMHIGSARRIPIVALFGSTVRELGFQPYGTRHLVVEHDVSCRPCSHIGRSRCPKKHFKCMEEIQPAVVREAIGKLLGN